MGQCAINASRLLWFIPVECLNFSFKTKGIALVHQKSMRWLTELKPTQVISVFFPSADWVLCHY